MDEQKPMGFIARAFTDGGEPSSGRIIMAINAMLSLIWVSYLVWVHKQLPSLLELSTFVCAPYLLTKTQATITDIWGKK